MDCFVNFYTIDWRRFSKPIWRITLFTLHRIILRENLYVILTIISHIFFQINWRIFWNTKNQENLKLGQKKVYRGIEKSYLPWFELDEFHKYLEAKYYVWPKYITSQLKQMSSHYVEIFYPLWNKCSKL